ncbi:helix-turn-helix transcriptional regulator, partial [Anseongella ginsenosidimutans]|uniref:helix-turn-helix transcriptional regulator n=1 Tax=Anseongella ginsenosidimutans TaxID=496056 RepID=UPI001044F045
LAPSCILIADTATFVVHPYFPLDVHCYFPYTAALLRQFLPGHTLFMDLCSYRIERKRATVYAKVKHPVLIFCYLLQGRIAGLDKQGQPEALLSGKQYAGFNLRDGRYRLGLEKGRHLVLNFALDKKLMLLILKNYPTLARLIREQPFLDDKRQALPLCKIDFGITRIISRLQKMPKLKTFAEPFLFDLVLELLMHYETQLQSGNFLYYQTTQEKIYDVKEFIQSNYTDPACQVSQLAREFNSTRKTLAREYKKEFGISMKEHITKLRMKLALQLLEQNCLIKEVTRATGYQNPFSFSRMFKKYYGYPPEKRKGNKGFLCLAY